MKDMDQVILDLELVFTWELMAASKILDMGD